MFSKTCEYGIRAAVYIASQSTLSRKVGLKEVAKEIDSPEAYTSKILQKLVKGGVIISEKGPTGGFSFEPKQLANATLEQVVLAIDGNELFVKCGLGLKQCNDLAPCPMHGKFKVIRDELQKMLRSTNVVELSKRLDKGLGFLKN